MNNKKIIIGLVGPMSCGKGTIAEYLEKKRGATTHRFSTMLRDVLNRVYVDITRNNMQLLSSILRKNFGEDLLANVIAQDVKNDNNKIVVVDGVRRLADIKYLTELDNFVLVKITAKAEIRYKRLTKRTENIGDTKKTFEEFLGDEKQEADAEIPIVMNMAKYEINNDGGFENLYQQTDNLIKSLTSS